ncbi:MAG TPA: NrfD/PsrC family molybdoenzyme membrane anchor subunit [Candidatus Sulfomarinibacteraceae bacterium]|nr:NrfD/PsrC family molybdoenzyme membrane anchor subunit [Candidatus Sulfomarinibacteraceae bacterium]
MKRLREYLFPTWLILLVVFILSGLGAAVVVFTRGLIVTNLSDLVPWGLWITIDLSAVALGAGAFMLSAAVYLLGLKHLEPVARTAVFIGFIAYTMACMTLLLDIGRPDRFWHAVVFWNIHSPLWEVTMCITFYLMVLSLEVLPLLARHDWLRQRFPLLAQRLAGIHRFAPVLAVVGLGLSLLHQSSLGATYGVLKARPIVYRPGMAILFIASAMAAGPALTVLASRTAAALSPRARVDDRLLNQITKFVGWALVAYLYLRFWDMLSMNYTYEPGRSEGLRILTSGSLAFNFWVGEILLGALIPMIILLSDRLRRHTALQWLALLFVVGGLVAYRWDTNIVSQMVVFNYLPQEIVPRYTAYVPSLVEFLAGAGVVAYGLLVFTLGARYLRIVDHTRASEQEDHAPSLVTSAAD